MDLSLRTETWGQDDQSWLGSQHGTEAARSITLDVSKFTANTHYPNGYFLSGIPLGKVTATGLYGPYAPKTSEVQTVSITGGPTGGTFTLTYSGQTTAAIAYNASAAVVQAALEALSNIGVGDVVCTGGALPGTAVTVTFGGTLAYTDVAAMTANSGSLTGGTSPTVVIATPTAGGAEPSLGGLETLVGFLFCAVAAPSVYSTNTKIPAALLDHGKVVAAKLPVPVDSAGMTDVAGRIQFL
ncbi:hypothetical protein ACFRCG_41840 [Embleya sp. NPDC056575]|uniref:hypothetical protein n=1 Tax=unclassified Embleya TaxID=2699296 RepID=UPI0036BDFC81